MAVLLAQSPLVQLLKLTMELLQVRKCLALL
jgi:hypothetical protein